MSKAVQITYVVPISDDDEPDIGVQADNDTEAIERAQESMAELIAQEGVLGGIVIDTSVGDVLQNLFEVIVDRYVSEGYEEHQTRADIYTRWHNSQTNEGELWDGSMIGGLIDTIADQYLGMPAFPAEPFQPDHTTEEVTDEASS